MVVWRGELNNPIRTLLLEAARDLPFCDVGTPKATAPPEYRKPYLSIDQQRRYRYIVSLEGNDVATKPQMDHELEFAVPDAAADL